MLYLRSEDIRQAVSFEEIMDALEEAYEAYNKKDFFMPDRIHIENEENTLLYMPCMTKSIFGTKILTLFPENPKKGEAVTLGVMMLNDAETGKPVAMINGGDLTGYRTGAVGGVGIRHTTSKNVKKLGMIGAGVQGYFQIMNACKARDFDQVTIYDAYSKTLPQFLERLEKELPEVAFTIASSSEELVKNSEVIVTATPSSEPVLPNDPELLKGKHYIAIGSYKPTMHEYPEAIFKCIDNMYIDTEFAIEESGDIITPLEQGWLKESQLKDFSSILGKGLEEETTLFKSVGMALFDIKVSELIYKKALEKGIGQRIEL